MLQMNDLLAMKSEVKSLSNLLQQLQSFLRSLSAHPPSHQQQSGGSGPGASGGGGGGDGGGMSGTGAKGKLGGPVGTSSGQGVIHQGQPNRQQQQQHTKLSHHLTTVSDVFSRFALLAHSLNQFIHIHHQSSRLFLNT